MPKRQRPRWLAEGRCERTARPGTPNYRNTPQDWPAVDRQRPGRGYRHVLMKRDVERFIGILPDWSGLSEGLNAIVLAPGDPCCDGWHRPGIVAVCAWERRLWIEPADWYYNAHRQVFRQLGVPCEEAEDGDYVCKFTESTARAYQLLHVLLHELGHHHDRMSTRSKRRASRGEGFAERYALAYGDRIWERYLGDVRVAVMAAGLAGQLNFVRTAPRNRTGSQRALGREGAT